MDGSEKSLDNMDDEVAFTKENWGHKKHDMVLNLGLVNKSAESIDQTPTPTRFIRNCEEVGLFQDLQNVNPFDETFKKAIESGKSGLLHVPQPASNDDTLHTPHILPHVVNANEKYSTSQSNTPSEFGINNVSIEDSSEPETYDLTIDTDDPGDRGNKDEVMSKLKQNIKGKSKTPPHVIVLNSGSGNAKKSQGHKRKVEKNVSDEKEKVREMNRAAQLRCRKRKQLQWNDMEEEIKSLRSQNAKLKYDNQIFKSKFYSLKEFFIKNKNSISISVLKKIEEILSAPTPPLKTLPKEAIPLKKVKDTRIELPEVPVLPVALINNQSESSPKPVLIQVVGSVSQLAVSVLPKR